MTCQVPAFPSGCYNGCYNGFIAKKKSFQINEKTFVGVAGFEPAASCSQSRRDNRATLHPEGKILIAERQGLEPWHRSLDDSLANCSITTLAPLQRSRNVFCFAVANLRHHSVSHKYFRDFFQYFFIFFQKHFTIKQIELYKFY